MRARLRLLALCGLVLGLALGVALSLTLPAEATRNSGGTYSLPPGNPVIPGTPISSSWANATLADLAAEMTNSLDRTGKGAMQAPLALTNGSSALPSMTFASDPDTGFYRAATDSVALSLAGTARQTWTSTGTSIAGNISATGTAGFTGATSTGPLTVTGNGNLSGNFTATGYVQSNTDIRSTGAVRVDVLDTNTGSYVNALQLGNAGGEAIGSKRTAGTGQFGIDFFTAGLNRISINRDGALMVPGQFVATPGLPIFGIYGANYNIDFGPTGNGGCLTSAQSLPGATTAAACFVSADMGIAAPGAQWGECAVTNNNEVTIRFCNASGGTVDRPTITYRVRIFQ